MNLPEVYKVQTIQKAAPIQVRVPGSKSITNRALLIAALAEGTSTLKGVLFSDDSRYFLKALQDLGFPVRIDEEQETVSIEGFGGRIPVREECPTIYVGSAGTAARFLTALLGLSKGRYRITSSEQMKKRPMKELLVALEELGAVITYEEEPYHFPFVIGNDGWGTHHVTIDIDKSSQFLSALLISSVLSEADFAIHVEGTHGMAYVDMTLAMMEQFGVTAQKNAKDYIVSQDAHYAARDYAIEPDLSAACYFYAMSPLLGVPASVQGVTADSLQGDIAFLSVLKDMGCSLENKADGITVLPPKNGKMKGGQWNLSGFSDQALTLAAIAPFADAPVIIHGIGHIRYQECDRIAAIETNLSAMGAQYGELEDGIMILPAQLHEARITTFDDHRVAMAFSLPGLLVEGIEIENPSCCRKTFEHYFEVFEQATLNICV